MYNYDIVATLALRRVYPEMNTISDMILKSLTTYSYLEKKKFESNYVARNSDFSFSVPSADIHWKEKLFM